MYIHFPFFAEKDPEKEREDAVTEGHVCPESDAKKAPPFWEAEQSEKEREEEEEARVREEAPAICR